MNSNDTLLSIQNLQVAYGNILALQGISVEVHEGEIVTLIGANGAGKSTLLRAISGVVPIRSGKITFGGTTWGVFLRIALWNWAWHTSRKDAGSSPT